MRRVLLLFAALLLSVGALALPPEGLPPGKWWDRPEVVQRLGLSTEQRRQLDEIFRRTANDLIDSKGEVEKRSIELRGLLDQEMLDRAAIQKAISRLSDARGHLFEHEVMMFVEMRGVLTDSQWTRFRDAMAARGNQPGRPQAPRRNRQPR